MTVGGSSHESEVGYIPGYKWINSTYPIYNWGYNPLTMWDEPPNRYSLNLDKTWFRIRLQPEMKQFLGSFPLLTIMSSDPY